MSEQPSQQEKAHLFKALHVSGDPVILFNVWDVDSALAVASQGAKAIATSHHAIANSYGYEDGESMPLELDLNNMQRIADATELPVSVDFETGYGGTPTEVKASVARALATGIVGINLEDRGESDGELRELQDACDRIAAARAAADERGVDLVINGRTNLFFYASDDEKANDDIVDKLLERASAFKDAGADCFFAPGMSDIGQIRRLCAESPLPINVIWFPGFPSPHDLSQAGVSRISYGPGPYLDMIEWLKDKAGKALSDK